MKKTICVMVAFAASMAMAEPDEIRIDDWDVNGDGLLSHEEAAAIQYDVFDTYDQDEDGDLKGREREGFEANLAFRRSGNQVIATMGSPDMNRDGLISAGEFKRWTGAMFDRLDTSGDGMISPEEMAAKRP